MKNFTGPTDAIESRDKTRGIRNVIEGKFTDVVLSRIHEYEDIIYSKVTELPSYLQKPPKSRHTNGVGPTATNFAWKVFQKLNPSSQQIDTTPPPAVQPTGEHALGVVKKHLGYVVSAVYNRFAPAQTIPKAPVGIGNTEVDSNQNVHFSSHPQHKTDNVIEFFFNLRVFIKE